MPRCLILCALVALSSIQGSAVQNWPEFRGPTGEGHALSTNLPLHWNSTNNVAWKQAIPGQGWSSPVLKDGKIFLTTALDSTNEGATKLSLRTLCLEESTGKILWNVEAIPHGEGKAPRIHNKNTHSSPTPIIANDRLYVHFGHLGTACLDLNGKVIWSNTELPYPPVHGNGGSPIIVDDALIFSGDGGNEPFIAALDKNNGKLLWKTVRNIKVKNTFSFCTPLLISVNEKQQVILPASGAVCSYDPKTGKEIWRVRYGEGYSVVPRPVFGHGLVFISSGFDKPSALAIRPDGQGDVTETHIAWSHTKSVPTTPSFILAGDELFMVSDGGIGSCLDAKTGKVHWQERLGGNYSTSPLQAGDRIYFQNEEGTGIVIKTGKVFEKLAENPLGERSLASYAASDDALFIRTAQYLYKIKNK